MRDQTLQKMAEVATLLDAKMEFPNPGTGGANTVTAVLTKKTSGNTVLNSAAWADFDTTTDLTIAAASGDVLLVAISCAFSALGGAAFIVFDVATIVSGAPVNYIGTAGGGSDFGIASLYSSGTDPAGDRSKSAAVFYTVQAGDVSSNSVKLRFRYRQGAGANLTFYSNATLPYQAGVMNLKH